MRSPSIHHRPCRRVLLASMTLLWALTWACKPETPAGEPGTQGGVRAGSPGTRIAAMAPAAVEMLDALGMLDRVVGVGDFVQWPPAARALPVLGPFHAPSVERVLELRVDLLVTSRSEAAAANLGRLEALGVPVLALRTDTYEGVLDSIQELGRALDAGERAQAVVQDIRRRMAQVTERVAESPRRRVLVVVGRDPLYVAGPGSHVDELITAAGGENVAGDALSAYQLVSMEAMLERRPEVIIDTSDNRPGALRGRVPGPWGQWSFLPAVARDRVFWVDPQRIAIPGPRLPEMAEMMARIIHPEIFGEPAADALGPLPAEAAAGGDGP